MKLFRFTVLVAVFFGTIALGLRAQTLYAPGGTVASSSSGVGIGVSSPTVALDVAGSIKATGRLSSTDTSAVSFQSVAATTGPKSVQIGNSGGDVYFGMEASAGGTYFTDSSAYATVIYNVSSNPIEFIINGTKRGTITTAGWQGAIGATSPNTGAFTTLSATGSPFVLGVGGSGATNADFAIEGSSGTSRGPLIRFKRNGVEKGYIGTESSVVSNTSDSLALYSTASSIKFFNGSGVLRGEFYSGGLSVTGALYATGDTYLATSTGNVGIGTSSTSYKLAVNGTIRAKEVVVDTGWSDYVFEDGYRLAPLNEVEARIKTDKHLPGIPSAAEVAEHGVSVGEMQSRLLAKVEELTLHLIAQEKQLTAQTAAIAELRHENLELRASMKPMPESTSSRP